MANNVCPPERKVNFETPPISRVTLGRSPYPKRKFSFPASLHANLLGLSSNVHNEQPSAASNTLTKRRFSNVGDVVSRKLSNTIGWRTQSIPSQEVISQGKVLCGQYIRNRLKRSGIFNKKLGLYRLRSLIGTTSSIIVRDTYPFLACAGEELERMYPKLYTNVTRQATASSGGVLVSDKAAAGLFVAICHDLIRADITWGKIVAIFAVAGGLAVDCVCQGHPEYLHGLMEGMTEVLEDDVAEWIASNGGWTGLCSQCKTPDEKVPYAKYAYNLLLICAVFLLCYTFLRFFVRFGLNHQ